MNYYCCREMEVFTTDPRVQIYYLPRMREYYIPLKFQHAVQGIFYCPWCGVKLANGVYLYRMIMKDQEKKNYEKLEDGRNIDEFFDGQWGKLVIIR